MAPDARVRRAQRPDLERLAVVPPVPALRRGRRFLVGYVGVMGKQEGID